MPNDEIDISQEVMLYLKHYPGKNDREFDEFYRPERAGDARAAVQALLQEAMSLRPDWSQMSRRARRHWRFPYRPQPR